MFVQPGRWKTDCSNCNHHKRWHHHGKCTGKNINRDISVSPHYCKCRVFSREVPDCVCGHSWQDHHHGCVQNPRYPTEAIDYGIHQALAAEECEATQHEGRPLRKDGKICPCKHYTNVVTRWTPFHAKGLPNDPVGMAG